ncbi:bifunctional sulfate adenylyltransferase/adenylylsulfate kinase [Desulfuromonas sp. TF]|uniref:bifunctional sulfate adenylyltransferase/adenylylsulfate kinase n=1 Tax=Desulfuromonas sp. TF TaxID=1232410 RepID=UPI0004007D7F|nr:bifunctional sulfate adenylyltransferase/adenylylsulfate kinase [Desulfuromonas sp. TF]
MKDDLLNKDEFWDGDSVNDLLVGPEQSVRLKREAVTLPSWDLTPRQIWDIELLLNGAFSPLEGFLNENEYTSVCRDMRLANGKLWPIPITLDVTEAFAELLSRGDRVALRHPEGMVVAILTVESMWRPDFAEEAALVFRTTSDQHPAVFQLFHETSPVYLGGRLEGLEIPPHHTFQTLRYSPLELRHEFKKRGWKKVVAFQTRNPMHQAHVELTKLAASQVEANLLLHPVVGQTKPGDVDYYARVRCYREVLKHYPEQTTMLSLLPLAMRMAGPREALWHGLIRKNYGCTHFIVGRNHADPGNVNNGEPVYDPYEAQELFRKHEEEMGITLVPFSEMVYVEELAQYLERSSVPESVRILSLSGTEFRRRLREGLEMPAWYSYPEVVRELRHTFPPRTEQGFTIFFTGLSGSGKSTIANILLAKLMEINHRPVTLLDGDIVRKNLSSELGFSKEHRNLNVERIGFVASEITKNRGIAICAPIAPYAALRRKVRETITLHGGFIEVFVSTPIEICEMRDRKGLYAKARAGLVKGFTGIDDPYEVPENPDVALDTSTMSADEAAQSILLYLEKEGYVEKP